MKTLFEYLNEARKEALKLSKDDFVDLGLSVKYAKYNIGATCGNTSKSWYGNYYAWGEVETKEKYYWGTYKYNRHNKSLNAHIDPVKYTREDGKTTLEPMDDVVTVICGSDYRMPTKAELEELKTLPNKWVTNFKDISGLNGRIFAKTQDELDGTFNDDTMLFIPAAGYLAAVESYYEGEYGVLWSSTVDNRGTGSAYNFFVQEDLIGIESRGNRRFGYNVRAVTK